MMIVAALTLFSGLLICLTCLPLIYRKVPMNRLYGIRMASAFQSEQRWYDINEYGGRCLARWSTLIIVTGVAGFFIPPEHFDAYAWGSTALVLLSVLIPVMQIYRWSRQQNAS